MSRFKVGRETQKTYDKKLLDGFFVRFMDGLKGAEIGFSGNDPHIRPIFNAEGWEIGVEGYDGLRIPREDGYYDWLYSSHCLEHVDDGVASIREWHRVVRPRGHIVIVVPHRDLYEKKMEPPSRFSLEHKRFYTPAILLKEIEEALPINTYRIRHLRDNDEGHDYTDPVDVHGKWLYETEVVIQKL